jgi:hypothetical protein
MTDATLVSVVVPAWNAERTLAETLRSVAAQSHRDIEILIVDDGSTDATAAIAEEFCAAETRARLISKPNGGVASARNRGISESKGEWVAPVDADDLWHPATIEMLLEAARSAPAKPGFVYCWRRIIDDRGRVVGTGARRRIEGRAFNRLAFFNPVACGSAIMASRDALVAAGGYDEELRTRHAQGYEDWMLQLAIARDHPIACVPEHLVGWRMHGANMSSDFEQMDRSRRLMFRQLAESGAKLPPSAVRQVAARDAFEIAQQKAVQRRYGSALGWLGRSLAIDPAGSGLMLTYRALRSVRRRLGGRDEPARRPDFFDVDPASGIGADPHRIKWFARLVDALDSRRLRRLEQLDDRL